MVEKIIWSINAKEDLRSVLIYLQQNWPPGTTIDFMQKLTSPQGGINVFLSQKQLIISNTGQEPVMPTEALFERFRKGKTGHDSTGLGLALVKQICSVHDFYITYIFTANCIR